MLAQVAIPPATRGEWRVESFIVSEDQAKMDALRGAFRGGRYVPAGTYTRLMRGQTLVMSDTRDEMRDHREAVRKASGHVLINGLGLGMVLQAVLAKQEVSRVTVVELSADVVALVGHHYQCDRLEIVTGSAFDYSPPKGVRYGAVWHDIWDHITADNLPEMTRLKRKYGRRAEWQGCWAEPQCRRYARHWR